MDVDLPQDVRESAARLGTGAPYALKVLARQLGDDPGMGMPSALPGVFTVAVDGDLFEDCPHLVVGYLREPDRIEIRYVNAAAASGDAKGPENPAGGPFAAAGAGGEAGERLVAEAWERVTSWLRDRAPGSYSALRPGASAAETAALERRLGLQVPACLRTLWSLTDGDGGVAGAGCLPGNEALMPLVAVAAFYEQQREAQAHQDSLNARRPEYDRVTVWRAGWIPVVSHGVDDRTSGLYLDTESGYLGRWSRYNDGQGDELDTLTTYLEDVADMLEAPGLAVRDRPGLVDGVLVWGSMLDAALEARWRPLAS
ncbi:SMI1/KNR4 family protein [Streptomyces sp. NPDC058052]|uniref:SMI1/KNR4 family protein n=1 Tax=Streptomyces sp. NPDC058052 TaxID=3346316 RepID=UPI0036E79373